MCGDAGGDTMCSLPAVSALALMRKYLEVSIVISAE